MNYVQLKGKGIPPRRPFLWTRYRTGKILPIKPLACPAPRPDKDTLGGLPVSAVMREHGRYTLYEKGQHGQSAGLFLPGRPSFSLKSVGIPAKELLARTKKTHAAGHIAMYQTRPKAAPPESAESRCSHYRPGGAGGADCERRSPRRRSGLPHPPAGGRRRGSPPARGADRA